MPPLEESPGGRACSPPGKAKPPPGEELHEAAPIPAHGAPLLPLPAPPPSMLFPCSPLILRQSRSGPALLSPPRFRPRKRYGKASATLALTMMAAPATDRRKRRSRFRLRPEHTSRRLLRRRGGGTGPTWGFWTTRGMRRYRLARRSLRLRRGRDLMRL